MKRIVNYFFKSIQAKSYKSNYYVALLSQFNEIESYYSLYKSCTANDRLDTKLTISFSKTVKFGCTLKNAKSKIARYNYHVNMVESLPIEILFYSLMIGDHKAKCQLHFHEGKLFFYSYNFSYVNDTQRNELLSLFENKYVPGLIYNNQTIYDSNENCIHIDKGLGLTANYICLKSDFFKRIHLINNNKEMDWAQKEFIKNKTLHDRL